MRNTPDSLTIAVIVLALFPPVFLMVPVLLRLLAIGRVAAGTAAMTLLLGLASLFGFVAFVGTHAPDLTSCRGICLLYLTVTARLLRWLPVASIRNVLFGLTDRIVDNA